MAEQGLEQCEFSLCTFNLLAPCHKRERTLSGKKVRETRYPDHFIPRHESIIELLTSAGPPDVICLQEFSSEAAIYELFERRFKQYTLHFYPRPSASEGLCILVNKRFTVERVFRQELEGSWNGRIALHVLVSLAGIKTKILVSTAHLEYLHMAMPEIIQVTQVKSLLSKSKEIVIGSSDPVAAFLSGDFNTQPNSSVYREVCSVGYTSAHHSVHGREPGVTHRDHRGNQVAADYIFYRSSVSQPTSAELHPAMFSDEKWPSDFNLSDHRPLVVTFTLQPCQSIPSSRSEEKLQPTNVQKKQSHTSESCSVT